MTAKELRYHFTEDGVLPMGTIICIKQDLSHGRKLHEYYYIEIKEILYKRSEKPIYRILNYKTHKMEDLPAKMIHFCLKRSSNWSIYTNGIKRANKIIKKGRQNEKQSD
jgi:hypothetical protein